MADVSKESALLKLRTRATVFMILAIIFLVIAIVFLGIWLGSFFYAMVPLYVGGVFLVLAIWSFSTWFLTSSLFYHAAATRS